MLNLIFFCYVWLVNWGRCQFKSFRVGEYLGFFFFFSFYFSLKFFWNLAGHPWPIAAIYGEGGKEKKEKDKLNLKERRTVESFWFLFIVLYCWGGCGVVVGWFTDDLIGWKMEQIFESNSTGFKFLELGEGEAVAMISSSAAAAAAAAAAALSDFQPSPNCREKVAKILLGYFNGDGSGWLELFEMFSVEMTVSNNSEDIESDMMTEKDDWSPSLIQFLQFLQLMTVVRGIFPSSWPFQMRIDHLPSICHIQS